jgi:hypothetical protein
MAETLFLLNPDWHDDQGGPWFCPPGAYIEGVLAFYPQLREAVDVVYLDHARPRPPVIEQVGEAPQSCPILILDGELDWPEAQVSAATGRRCLQAHAIAPYLAARYGVGRPQP